MIKVTVDRREQNIQDYAGSASAFSEEDLARVGVHSVRELGSAQPYAEIGTQEGNTEIFIRGVGSDNNTELGDPASATHIDGVYIPRPRGVGSMLFDLERVELNRGPQGTIRGRNAVAGSVNLITARPKLNEFAAEGSVQLGNYSQRVTRGMVNIPIGNQLAVRFATFSENRDPFYENAGPVYTLTPPESADTLAYRMSAEWKPLDRITVNVMHDWTQEKGTGYAGTNFVQPLNAGLLPEEIPNPRAVIYRGPQHSQDMLHWGVRGDFVLDLGPASIQYLSSYRDLNFRQVTGSNAGVAFPGQPPPTLDDWSATYWHTTSKSVVQELRIYAPDSASFRWTVGGFFFNEKQTAFLGSTADQQYGFAGIEFNMPDVKGRSWAGYADATLDILADLRATAGVRVTQESKSRNGIGHVFQFDGLTGLPYRFGTEGFRWAEADRTTFTVPQGGVQPPFEEFLGGIARFGARDTLPGLLEQEGVTARQQFNEQHGTYDDTFLDFRVGLDHDLSPENLIYATFSTGHKSGGFNDNILIPGTSEPIAPTYGPESLYATELGSKNEFVDRNLVTNVAMFWYAYNDQQFVTNRQIAETGGPQAASSSVRFNAATSRILGLELETSYRLPLGFVAAAQAMVLDATFTEGTIADTRVAFSDFPNVDLEGNELPRAPRLTVNYSLAQNIPTPIGYFDWIVSAQTKTRHYMTVFNGEGRDPSGNVNGNLSDVVPTYTRLDAGVGWTHNEGKLRLESFVSNLTDVAYMTSFINTPNLNLRFFNPPRQVGVRLSVFL